MPLGVPASQHSCGTEATATEFRLITEARMSNAPADPPAEDGWYTGSNDVGEEAFEVESVARDTEAAAIVTEGSGEGIAPLALSKDKVKLINYAAELEANGGRPTETAFSARVWAQVSLPYRDPGPDKQFWVRKNGSITLKVRPASITNRNGEDTVGYPFGILPRHIMTWMATEALRTESPELTLGKSMTGFMEKLQVERGGTTQARLRTQMERVFGSQLSVEGLTYGAEGQGYGLEKRFIQITDATRLWFSENEELDVEGLFASKIILSEAFYNSIMERPIPVDPRALQLLGTKPLTFDIYVWIGYRLYSLEHPTRMAWSDLHVQFGSQTKRLRDFRKDFHEALQNIQIIMPKLRYEIEQDYFLLYPSPTPIEQNSRRKVISLSQARRRTQKPGITDGDS